MLFQPLIATWPGGVRSTVGKRGSSPEYRPLSPRTASRPAAEPLPRLLNVPTWPALAAVMACGALLGAIALLDWKTGATIRITPLYFLPIIIASLRFAAPGALVVAGTSALLAVVTSPAAMKQADEPWALLTNSVVEALGFAFVALVTGALQRQGQRLREQRRALEAAQGALQADMLAAELLQGHLLRRPLPALPGWEMAAEIVFARGVGGDFYDLRCGGGQLAICVADVSGKGAQAALISAALRGLLDEAAGNPADPPALLRHLNERLFATLPDEMFVTMFYGCLALESGELCYASAGHDPPLLCRGEHVAELMPTGPALGLGLELPQRPGRRVLQPGETLLLYTDGLTSARDPFGERLGEAQLAAWLRERAALPPAVLVPELLGLAGVAGPAPLEDDIAIIALRRPA